MLSSLTMIIGLLSLWSPDKGEAVGGYVCYDHRHTVLLTYTRAMLIRRPHFPNKVVTPYQRRFYPSLGFRLLKHGITNSSVYKIFMQENFTSTQDVNQYTYPPGPHDTLITVGSSIGSNMVYKVNDGCYKYSWWSSVHKTTDSCHGSRGVWTKKYFLMPSYLWDRYMDDYVKLKRGSFGDLVVGIPYTFRSSFVYSIRMNRPEQCTMKCAIHETKAWYKKVFLSVARASLPYRYIAGRYQHYSSNARFFKIQDYFIDAMGGCISGCPSSAYDLVQLSGSTNCFPDMLSIGPELLDHPDAQRAFGGSRYDWRAFRTVLTHCRMFTGTTSIG